jgi:hypothetical protein
MSESVTRREFEELKDTVKDMRSEVLALKDNAREVRVLLGVLIFLTAPSLVVNVLKLMGH